MLLIALALTLARTCAVRDLEQVLNLHRNIKVRC